MGNFKLKLVVWFALLALLPLGVAFYGYDTLARQSATRRVDASLEAGLRGAVAAYTARLDAAAANARRLAGEQAVQKALRAHDRAALTRLLPRRPHGPAASRTVAVVDRTRVLGHVTVWVPLRSLGSGLPRGDRLVVVPRDALPIAPGVSGRIEFARHEYRALATAPLADPRGFELVALSPQSALDAQRTASDRRILMALLASLLLIGVATYLLGRSVVGTLRGLRDAADAIAGGSLSKRVPTRGNDEFAQVGRAFNRMAAQLEQRLEELDAERLRVNDAISRFGAALAATHDPGQLVRIVVESAVEATGATGGLVLGPDGELARAGDPDAGSERIALPMRVGSSDFGLLVLTADVFDPPQVETAAALTAQVVVALENARLHRVVQRQALVDSLTGLANRRSLEERLRAELARAARFHDSTCVVLADLDDFKSVNDRYGHAAGDQVLKAFASALRDTVRESDTAARWGGEEFALVLSGTDAEGGARLAERAREAIERQEVSLSDGPSLSVTASFGVASYPDSAPEDLLAAADSALYEAKRQGKNRVSVAAESTPEEIV